MNKKISVIILSVLLISLLAITISASGLSATTESKSCAQDNTVTINLSLSESVKAASGGVEIVYDKTKLQLIDGLWNTSGAILSTFDMDKEKGAFAYASPTSLSGKIFSVKFKVISNAPIGETEVKCILQLKDASGNAIDVNNVSGKISITCNHKFTKKTTEHLANPASCTSAAKYYYTCSVCDAKGTTTFTQGDPTSHIFDKMVETEVYLVSSVTCADTADYYYSCECGTKGIEIFNGDASWSHSYSESWYIGTSGHWHACLECGQQRDVSGHIAGEDKICSVCSFVIEEVDADTHVHIYGTEWKNNTVGHWHECSCGAKESLDFHVWDEGVITREATENIEGERKFSCTICNENIFEVIPKLETEEKPNITPDENTNAIPENNGTPIETPKGISPIIVIAITIGAIAIIEGAAFGIYKAASKKKETNGKNDEADQTPEESANAVEEKEKDGD